MIFKTWGSAIQSLKQHLREDANKVYEKHFGTPQYFKILIPRIHDSFVSWCSEHGIDNPAAMRKRLSEEVKKYPQWRNSDMDYLLNHLPNPYNVRGVWTPRPVRVATAHS